MKLKNIFLTTLAFLPFISQNSTVLPSMKQFSTSVKKTYADHPSIAGFQYNYGSVNKTLAKEPTGYFYYDVDVYYSNFTDVSRLYIIHVRSNFTPGKQANLNGDNYFDWNYDLWTGYIHLKAYQYTEGNKRSSSFRFIKSWPLSNSDSLTYSVTSGFSSSLTLSNEIKSGIDFAGNATVEKTSSSGFTLAFSETTTIYGQEPEVSRQDAAYNQQESQWYYSFKKPCESSFQLDTYYMFELKNDGYGYQDYSFKYDVDIKMTDIAWRGYLWQQQRDTTTSLNDSYGLY